MGVRVVEAEAVLPLLPLHALEVLAQLLPQQPRALRVEARRADEISLYLPVSPYTSLDLPRPPQISPYLATACASKHEYETKSSRDIGSVCSSSMGGRMILAPGVPAHGEG